MLPRPMDGTTYQVHTISSATIFTLGTLIIIASKGTELERNGPK